MANNKTTYVLQFDAELGALEKKLNSVKGLMSGVLGSTQAPKGLDKSFEKLGDLIEKIRQKASQPIESKGGFTSIGKDINAANTALNGMLKIIKSIDSMSESAKISFLPPEAQEQLKAIVKSLTDYADAIDAATTETAELIKARNDLAKAEESVSKAKNKVESRKGLLEEAKAEKEATKQSIEAIKQRKDKLTELRKEQEKIERFYNTIGEDGNKPNRSKKYDGASMRPQDIKRKIAELESASVGDADALVELQENYKKASNNVTSYINQLSAAERALKDNEIAHGELTEKVGQLEQAFKDGSVEKQEQAFKQLREEAKKLGINLEDISEGFSEANVDALIQKFVELKQKGLDPLNEASNKAETNVREMGVALDYTRKKTDDAADSFEQMTEATRQQEAFENKIKQFLGLAGAAQVMRHALRDAIQTISELDRTMTEMSVVTDLSVGDYWDQLPQYTERANELGLAINDVYKADTLYYQQGLKTNEVMAISTETMKMAQIAGLDTAEATDRMTAALRGFNMELDETNAKRISDVYSELAAITAADVDEISTAMTKTASIASSAGMEFETTAAFLSQIIETTRESAETAGTAMKTVIARFQELKKAPDEIGEIDGEIVDANAIETALRSVGVELRESSGQFRELDDVFLELSSKWNGLDKNTQRYIATIAAGSRQQSRFIAMMSDYARTQELVTSANNSAGASSRQFEKTAESLRFKINKLKNAWHEFTMGIMESDLVKFGVDVLTKFLEIVNKITSAFEGFAGSITKISSIITIFKLGSAIFEKIKPLISQFLLSLVDDFKDKGEKAGRGYAFGLKKGAETAGAEGDNNSVKVSGTLGRVENKGIKGHATNAGLSIMEAAGVGHFADAREAHLNVKQAKAILGTNKKSRAEQLSKYQNNKQKLESLQEKMTIHKNGTASKKGKQGLMTREEVEKTKTEIEDLTKSIEEYEQAGEKLAKNSEQQWNSITAGLQSASMAAAGVSLAFGMIGQAFTDAGFEGMGKVLSGIGTAFMVISTVASIVSSILPLLSAGFASAGAAGTASGIATTASWGVVGLIVLAVMAGILITIGIILLVLNAIKNASPEKKLEDVQKAADSAAEAADSAAEAYDKLVDSLNQLDGKYKALEELTEGTEEWNQAVRDINNSVLELIDEYPELAKFVENKQGVLTIDVNSAEVQDAVNDVETRKIMAKNNSTLANIAVADAQSQVDFGRLEAVKKVSSQRGWSTFGKSVGAGAAIGGAGGGITGAAMGSFAGPIGSALLGGALAIQGAVTGAATGLIVGAIAGPIKAAKTKTDETLQDAVASLADSVSSGAVDADYDDMFKYLTETMGMTASEAEIMAKEFSNDIDSLIEYGESVNAVKEQQRAAYDSIASSARELANTLDMSADQIQQSSVAVDGDIAKEFYEQKMNELEGVDGKEMRDNAEVQEAIRKTYGETATIDKKGKVTYQKDGENKEVTLTAEQVRSMVASNYATEQTANAITYSDEAISKVATKFGEQIGNEQVGKDVINALYMDNKGQALTQKNLDQLTAKEIDYQAIWDSLSYNEKQVYGGDIENLKNDFSEAIKEATKAFDEAGDAARDFMTADMAKSFKKQLDKVAQLAGGEQNAEKIMEKTVELLGGTLKKDAEGNYLRDEEGNILEEYNDKFTKEQRQEIQNRIDTTDWTNLEQLELLQLDLVQNYGMELEVVQEYIKEVKDAAHATSKLATTIEVYGKLYQANQKVEQSLRKISELQWEYNEALKAGGDATRILSEQLDEYKNASEGYAESYNASTENLQKILGQMYDKTRFGGYDLSQFLSVREDGSLDTSVGASGQGVWDLYKLVGENEKKAIEELIENYNEEWTSQQDNITNLQNTLDDIRSLEQEGRDTYYELRDMAKESILNAMQKQIDIQQETLNATKDASAQVINKIQEQIDDTRQARENEEAEKNIAKLQSQQAYLAMDTSGASALQTAQLGEQINQAEQDYEDSLIDQTIQTMQDANNKAWEQREHQISLAQSQLESYQESVEFQRDIDNLFNEMLSADQQWKDTELGQLMLDNFTQGMSGAEAEEWQKQISEKIGASTAWQETDWAGTITTIKGQLTSLPDLIGQAVANGADVKALDSQVEGIQSLAGLSASAAGVTKTVDDNGVVRISGSGANGQVTKEDRQKLDSLTRYSEGEKQALSANQATYQKISSSDYAKARASSGFGGPMTSEQYYAAHASGIANGTHKETYASYLNKFSNEQSRYELAQTQSVQGAIGATTKGFNNAENKWFDLTLWGGTGQEQKLTDINVETGSKVSTSTADKLQSLWESTATEPMKGSGYKVVLAGKGNNDDKLYISQTEGTWFEVLDQGANLVSNWDNRPAGLINYARTFRKNNGTGGFSFKKFETGGLANFTGPAWLDGTKSRPEYILNAAQTERFFSLVDILEKYEPNEKSGKSGDNYFEIEINVEKLENDYDVEKVADKIRRMIYEDASYRNVNAVGFIR